MPRTFSGKEIAKILSRKYEFVEIGTSGSHMKMRKSSVNGITTTIIPLHAEVSIGTFRSILRQARIDYHDFLEKSRQ